jgi:hypothetical protein
MRSHAASHLGCGHIWIGFQMQGQWLGRYTGSNSGEAILELDEVGDHYEGKAYILEDQQLSPSTIAYVSLPKGVAHHKSSDVPLRPLDPTSLDVTEWQVVRKRHLLLP